MGVAAARLTATIPDVTTIASGIAPTASGFRWYFTARTPGQSAFRRAGHSLTKAEAEQNVRAAEVTYDAWRRAL